MKTDRGKEHSFRTFKKYKLNDKDILPSLKANKKSLLFDNININNNLFTNKKSKYLTLSTETNNFTDKNIENHKINNTNPNGIFLDKKIIHLINCYRNLNFSEDEKKLKIRRTSFQQNNPKDKNINNLNILSKSLTKAYKISEQHDKEGVKKLDEWDKNNLAQLYGNSDMIYKILYNYYSKFYDYDKMNELDYFKSIIKSSGEDLENIILIKNNANNKIIKDFLNLKIKEQTYILKNNLSKSQTKFNKTLLFMKEKKIAINLGIDNETLAEIRKAEEKTGYNYERLIKDKDKKELLKKEELINLLIKIFNKKLEKSKKEKKQSENFEKMNKIYVKHQSKIIKIQIDIDAKRELYDKINGAEYEKENMVEKINLLQKIKYESEQAGNDKKRIGRRN